MKTVWTDTAKRDLTAIFDYILQDAPSAALRTCDRIDETALKLTKFPRIGRAGRIPETRELVVSGLPYIVVYSVARERIDILTVRHTSREWPETIGD